jgi:predicted Ser/Thr protein kinase
VDDPEQIGPFRVLRRLGKGGMGVVYAVQDPSSGRPLALKLVLDQGTDETTRERFWREAEMLARISHRNVVRVHSVGQLAEGPYILEELVEGEPLTELAREDCPPRQAAQIARDLADAIATLHGAGILHRDLKLSNVMLTANSIPVLLDFGISRDQNAETLTRTGALMGSPGTMAPEQAAGQRATAATDVYGLGVVLYGLLTGSPPFTEGGLLALKKVLRDDPRWPRAIRADTPRELDSICRRAMAKKPEDRYPSPEAFAADLARYLGGERQQSQSWRWPLVLCSALVACAALAAALMPRAPALDAPSRQARATPTRSRAPAPKRLWSLRPEQRLDVVARVEELSDGFRAQLQITLQLRVMQLGPTGVARLEARFKRLEIRFSTRTEGDTIVPLDTSREGGAHPFDGLRSAVDQPFTLSLDQATGAVSDLKGVREILRRAKARKAPPPLEGTKSLVPALLSASYLRRMFACLHVTESSLPWRKRSGGAHSMVRKKVGPPTLGTLIKGTRRTVYQVRARSEYRDGLFLRGEFSQSRIDGRDTMASCALELRPAD